MKKIIFLIILLCFKNCYSCDCVPESKPLIERYNLSKTIFDGKVISIKNVELNKVNYDEIVFFVKKNYKGATSEEIVIYQEKSLDCEIVFSIGGEWIVWANVWNGLLSTNSCSRTKNIDKISKENIDALENISNTEGYKIWYDENSDKVAEGFLSKTLANGHWIFYKYGFISSEGTFRDGVQDGKWISYYEVFPFQQYTENKECLATVLNGKNSSRFRKINEIINYSNGIKQGDMQSFNVNGNLYYSSVYKNDVLDGVSIFYSENGKTKKILNYKNGKLDGMCVSFFEEGIIELIYNFKNGKQSGDWTLYDKGGIVICSSKNNINFPKFIKDKYYCNSN